MEGFIPIRMVNAELKFCVFIIAASIIVGIIWIRVHLAARVIAIGKSISIFGIIFLSSVFIPPYLPIILKGPWYRVLLGMCFQFFLALVYFN